MVAKSKKESTELKGYTFGDKGLIVLSVFSIAIGLTVIVVSLIKLDAEGYTVLGDIIELEVSSKYGQFIGGLVGTIWAFAGFLLLFLTLRIQKRELDLQIKELKQTKDTFIMQRFDNTFFNLLKHQNYIVKNIHPTYQFDVVKADDLSHSGIRFIINAKKVFTVIVLYAKASDIGEKELLWNNWFSNLGIEPQELDEVCNSLVEGEELGNAKKLYRFFLGNYYQQLGHYFRHLYHILKFLDKNSQDIDGLDSKSYSDFLKAQLSVSESFLIYYDGLLYPKMKALVEKYRITEHMSSRDLASKSHENFYNFPFKGDDLYSETN